MNPGMLDRCPGSTIRPLACPKPAAPPPARAEAAPAHQIAHSRALTQAPPSQRPAPTTVEHVQVVNEVELPTWAEIFSQATERGEVCWPPEPRWWEVGEAEPPPPEPKVWWVPYPSRSEMLAGNLLDVLA